MAFVDSIHFSGSESVWSVPYIISAHFITGEIVIMFAVEVELDPELAFVLLLLLIYFRSLPVL